MDFAPAETLFDEITTFLLSQPTPEHIIAFRPSEQLNQRLHDLLDKNKQQALSSDERAELERFLQVDHLFMLLKVKARLLLSIGRYPC